MTRQEELEILHCSRRLMLQHDITERDVCKQLYISETGLRNIYHKYLYMPPKKYMLSVTMSRAKALLRTSSLSVPKIAAMLHYANVSKFAKRFQMEFGVTPYQYRKALRASQQQRSTVE